MKSMTGYGRGECSQNGFKITVELSSVNRKQSEILINLPRELEPLEPQVRDEINRHVARGRLTVRVMLHMGNGDTVGRIHLNLPLARAYAQQLQGLARSLGVSESVSLDLLTRAPGVMRLEEEVAGAEDFWPVLEKSLRQALTGLVAMREKEGAYLTKELRHRLKLMRKSARRVQQRAPAVGKAYRLQLLSRLQRAGLPAGLAEDQRLLQEVVLFTDRSDISEELARLQSHFEQFEEGLEAKEPVGRTLEFLVQEVNREVNTIGSKANDSLISRQVVTLKGELEKVREQIQNIE